MDGPLIGTTARSWGSARCRRRLRSKPSPRP